MYLPFLIIYLTIAIQ